MAGPGGKRPGAGRPPGSKNKIPSKRAVVQEQMLESAAQFIRSTLTVLLEIATVGTIADNGKFPKQDWHKNIRPSDRVAAIDKIHTLFIGRPAEQLNITETEPEPAPPANIDNLLREWPETPSPE